MSENAGGRRVVEALGRNTLLVYMHRDASNWKQVGKVVFRGRPVRGDEAAAKELRSGTESGVYFIPEQVALESLLLGEWGNYPAEDDHGWHEIVRIEETDDAPTDSRTIDEFIGEFVATKWNPAKSSVKGGYDPQQEKRGVCDWVLEI